MENLGTLGIFFGGLGILLLGCGFMWWCSIYQKINSSK